MNDLEHQRFSIEEQGKSLKQLERDDSRAEMKLSLFASVTNIIPSLDDQSKISGCILIEKLMFIYFSFISCHVAVLIRTVRHLLQLDSPSLNTDIVQRDKNAVEDFDFDPKDMSEFETLFFGYKLRVNVPVSYLFYGDSNSSGSGLELGRKKLKTANCCKVTFLA
nr:kinetochore protein SPC24 homolog [Ipomoea batatas]